jgi:hypothetical protein
MNYKKLASAALTATTVLWMVGAAALPLANAQTSTSSLAATIASLQAQIASLTAELNSSGTTTASVGATTYDFTSDLTVGSTGSDVQALQTFLIGQGDLVLATPTMYFGSLTQAALAKFQAAHNIAPAVGYFGPITRAFVNSLATSSSTTTTTTMTLPAGCTSTSGYSTTTGASCSAPATLPAGCSTAVGFSPTTGASCSNGVTVATGAPLSIALDAQTPGAVNVAQGAVNEPVLKLDFTAGATPVTVTNLVLTRSGLSQDSDLNNVYLYSGATKLASNLGFNNGAITFSNGAGLFTVPANSTMVVTVTVDVAGSSAQNSGHIFQIGLASASDVTGGTFSGNFPLNSAQFTIAAVNNLATLTLSGFSSSTVTVNAGQLNDLVGQFTVQAGNNPVKVTQLNFTNVGSVTPSYLQNIKLMDGSTQLGATISSLGSNNIATFDLSGAPLMLTSGQSAVLSLYADITGGVNRSFQFSVQQSSDIQAVDTTYGVGIGASVQSGLGNFPVDFSSATIQNGNVVTSKDANSPSTYAVAGNTNQVLGVFDVLASGDSIKFNELDFVLTKGANTVNNFRVVDDQGAQIGSTVNVSSSATIVTEGSGSLNYIIPANTTRVLTVYGDLPSTASGTIQVQLGGNNTSAQSYTTFVTATVAAVSANSLSILASNTNLLASENYGLGAPVSAPAGAQSVKIGSYTLTAGQVNGVNLTGVTIVASSTLATNYLSNLEVMDGSTQIGTTYATVGASDSYSFNGSGPILIPANGSVTIDVYANISSSITATSTLAVATTLSSVNASTQAGQAVSITSTPGQSVAFTTGGVLTGSLSAGTSQASYLGMGITGVNVAQYQFVADNNGGETLTQVKITDSSSAATTTASTNSSDLINYRLTNSAGAVLSTASVQNGILYFNLSGLVVPSNSTQYVNLVADTNSYPYATSADTHAYALDSYNYTNASVATTTNVSSNNIGNLFTVYQTTLGVAGASFSNPNSISGVNNIVGEFNFTAGSGNINPIVKSVTLSTGGSLIQASTSQTLGLYDASAPSVLLASSTATSTNSFTFDLTHINPNQWTIPYSSSKTLLVETLASPTGFVSQTNNGGSYQVLLKGVTWSDGTTAGANVSSLSPSISIPVASQNITNLSN